MEYINLVLIQQDQIPIYSASEVKSKMGDIDEFRGKSLTLEEVTSYSSSHKVIIIEGCPGIGKTTLACKLCHDWAEKKLPWVKDYWLLLYIPLRTPLMRTAQSLADLLQYFEDNYSYDDYQCIKVSQGKGVLLILDGWDELRPSCRGRDMFFPRLIQGQVLPECSIIITSRPGATIDIRSFATRIIEILGFTEEQVSQYICSYFKSDISTGQKLIEDLEAYPNVASTCYVAVNLTIVCYVYKACGCQLPSTLTDVYELFIIHTIKRHFKKASVTEVKIESAKAITDFDDEVILKSLANLALRSLEKGDLIFNKEELMAECTVDETEAQFDGYGLLSKSSIARKYGIEYYYHFLHLTIHEYLAAYSIFNMTERQQFDWLGKHIRNESFGMVLKFYCGMDKFQSRSARTLFSSEQTLGVPFALECIFEGQWKDACKKVAKQTSGSLSIIRPIQPYRALVYGYVMANAEAKWNLNWQKRAIEEQELKCLGRHILDAPNTLYKVSISHILVISRKAVDMLSQILKTQYLLSSFTLNNTQFDDESVASICEAFKDHQMLQVLDLSNNKNLTEKCSEYICSLLPTLPSLKNLNIQGNNFGENGFKKILSVCPATIDVLPLAL